MSERERESGERGGRADGGQAGRQEVVCMHTQPFSCRGSYHDRVGAVLLGFREQLSDCFLCEKSVPPGMGMREYACEG